MENPSDPSWIDGRAADKAELKRLLSLQPVKYLFTLKPDEAFLAQAQAYRECHGIEPPKNAHVTVGLFQAHPFYAPERITRDLEIIAEETPSFKVNMRGWDVFKDAGSGDELLVLRAQYADELKMLHMNIAASIIKPNIYRTPSSATTQEETLAELIERRMGSRFFGSRYQPHMSFGKLTAGKPESDDFHGVWTADRIYLLAKSDGWHEIATFPLAKPF